MEYNHWNELEDFQEELEIIRDAGFKPIAVSQMFLEDTFVFETDEEAMKAYKQLEDCENPKLAGWWYGKKDFEKSRKEHESILGVKVLVYWLDV
jgi:hypothetical protein